MVKVITTLGKEAGSLVDDVYKLAGKGSVAQDLSRVAGSKFYKMRATQDIAESIGKALPLEPKVVNELAGEAFEIFTRNNPADAAGMMRAMVRNVPGLDNKAGKLLGVMAYESLIGLNMGVMRSGVNSIYRNIRGWL